MSRTPKKIFAQRTQWDLTPNRYSDRLDALRAQGASVLDLTESNPTRCALDVPSDEISRALAGEQNRLYKPSAQGNLEARRAICRYYKEKGLDVRPERVFLTASTSEAYSYLFRLLADPGDRVLFPRPSYPLFSFLGDLNDIDIRQYMLDIRRSWAVDEREFRQNVDDRTKAVVLVNPNNPTGSFIDPRDLDMIDSVCRDHGIPLICDEVFHDYLIEDHAPPSLVNHETVLTFVLGGLSKTLGLPQMKLSWIVVNGPDDLVQEAIRRLEVIADTYLSVNTPVQNAVSVWLQHRQRIQREITTRVRTNYDILTQILATTDGCRALCAQGGWYAVFQVPDALSEEEWILSFLNEDHVAVHPGYFFDFPAEAYMIVSLLPECTTFREAVQRVQRRIDGKMAARPSAAQRY